MVGRDKCGPSLLCKKWKRHSDMLGGMRLDSYASSDGKDAIQYSRASSDMVLNGPMVLERRTEKSCSEFGSVVGSVSTRNNSQSDLPFCVIDVSEVTSDRWVQCNDLSDQRHKKGNLELHCECMCGHVLL